MRWMKFNRRRLLLAGLGAGILTRSARDYWHNQTLSVEDFSEATLGDRASVLEAAYASETQWQEQLEKIKAISDSVTLTPPKVPYSREVSKRLIRCCKLAVQQYKTGRTHPNYDGSIQSLPEYSEDFQDYTQKVTFVAEQEIIEDYFKIDPRKSPGWAQSPLKKKFKDVEGVLEESLPKIFQGHYRLPVYIGFVLTSKQENIIVFRGTQTQAEWVNNLKASQQKYINPANNESYGWIHRGFLSMATEVIDPLPAIIAKQLDPSIPCYITGHSLGAAVATVAALDIALKNPQLSEQIQLYTYAGPRVGDPTFARKYSQLLPNSYRVVNLADSVPLVPSSKMGKNYLHVGEEWSFLAQFGEVLLNHIVDTYREGLEQEVETNQARSYPISSLI